MATTKKARYAGLVKTARAGAARNRKAAEALIGEIRKRLARIESDFHPVGVSLQELATPAMYAAMGYGSFVDLLKGEKLTAKTTAYRLMAVAESFGVRDAKKLGRRRRMRF